MASTTHTLLSTYSPRPTSSDPKALRFWNDLAKSLSIQTRALLRLCTSRSVARKHGQRKVSPDGRGGFISSCLPGVHPPSYASRNNLPISIRRTSLAHCGSTSPWWCPLLSGPRGPPSTARTSGIMKSGGLTHCSSTCPTVWLSKHIIE